MKYLSVCSGIEAATQAWDSLGWTPVAFSEIEKFPSAVLAHHYPDIPNLGDMTKFNEWGIKPGTVDLLVGGTPCQSFSVAGLRKGLADSRGNLTLTFLAMVEAFRPGWVVWENVPGVLSDKTNAFGNFIAGLDELGYDCAWRVLDAQHFGVPQRRRRVFVVANPRGSRHHPATVLFEPESLQRDLTPSRESGEGIAPNVAPGLTSSGRGVERVGESRGQDPVIPVVHAWQSGFAKPVAYGGNNTTGPIEVATARSASGSASGRLDFESETFVMGYFTPRCIRNSESANETGIKEGYISDVLSTDGPGAVAFETRFARNGRGAPSEVVPPLKAQSGETGKGDAAPCVAFAQNTRDEVREMNVAGALAAEPGAKQQTYLRQHMAVRRLTPRECERLQGFPDDFTLIPWRGKPAEKCPDGPRYKALGNSMAVPVMAWIGERIATLQA